MLVILLSIIVFILIINFIIVTILISTNMEENTNKTKKYCRSRPASVSYEYYSRVYLGRKGDRWTG